MPPFPQRFEQLLKETEHPIGILFNGSARSVWRKTLAAPSLVAVVDLDQPHRQPVGA